MMANSLHKMLDRIKHNETSLSLLRVLCVVLLVLIGFGGYHLYKAIRPTPYVSKKDGFQIVFHQAPTVNKLTPEKVSAGEETGNIYSVGNASKGTVYAVYVTTYPKVNFSSLSKSATIGTLDNEIEALASSNKAKLSDGRDITFEGLTAVEADLTPTDHSESATKVLAFLKGGRSYVLLGTGVTQSRFNAYTRTFHFIK